MKRPEAYDPGEWHPNSSDLGLVIRALIRISEQLEFLADYLGERDEL